ncbi:MAG: beta-ketoacyl-ACP synthase II [Actinomycetota bacterium]
MPDRRRVAVTGLGPVTPVGTGVEEFWESLIHCRSGVGPLTRFDASEFPTKIAAEVRDFDVTRFLEPRKARRFERFTQFAYVASVLAMEHAGLKPIDLDPARVGVVVGTGIGGISMYEEEHTGMLKRGPRFVSPMLIAMMIPNAAAGSIAIELGFTGPNECPVTACAASGHAIARSVDLIRNGAADVMLAGGSEAAIAPLAVASFCTARALSTRNDDPETACRPFDATRDGFVMGEGATMLVLEAMEVAEARGARVLAEILGYGLSADAYSFIASHPEGLGAAAAMTAALSDAQVTASEIGYINAHATGTPIGDASETKGIRKVFGAQSPPVSSTKSMTGHLMGAAGATEAAAVILALNNRILPPTINYEHPDPECDLDVIPNHPRPAQVEVAMSNSFGFGGPNASIVFALP